jgi:hypothetical protein
MGDHCTLSQRLRAWSPSRGCGRPSRPWSGSGSPVLRRGADEGVDARGTGVLTASQQRSISLRLARARPQIVADFASFAISETAAKSPSEAMGNPASMMSTPISSSSAAISSFSSWLMVAPGDCSPSRRVVSKIRTRFCRWSCRLSCFLSLSFGPGAVPPLSGRAEWHAQRRLRRRRPGRRVRAGSAGSVAICVCVVMGAEDTGRAGMKSPNRVRCIDRLRLTGRGAD